MRIDNDPKLDFDDVLIRPKRSEAPSRSAIILEREHRFLNSGATWKGIPIVASNMDTVGTMAMARGHITASPRGLESIRAMGVSGAS